MGEASSEAGDEANGANASSLIRRVSPARRSSLYVRATTVLDWVVGNPYLTGLFEGLLVIRPRLFHSLPIWFSKHILQNLSDSVSRKFFPELNSENALVLRQLRVGPLSNLFLVCRSATFSDDQS